MARELTKITGDEEAIIRAAEAYSKLSGRIQELEKQLRDASVILEGRNERITQLERAMNEQTEQSQLYAETMYNRMKALEASRDDIGLECEQFRAVFFSLKSQIMALDIPFPKVKHEDHEDRPSEAEHSEIRD